MNNGRHNKEKRFSRRSLLRIAVYSSVALTGCIAYGQSDNLEIIQSDVPIKGLPPSFDGFSIGVMADFHAGAWGNREVISDAITAMQQLKPDVITLLGDYVDGVRSHDGQHINNAMFLFQKLGTLKAPFGVYAVLGNHDHWMDRAQITALLSKENIIVLIDNITTLDNGLVLAGVDDYWEGNGNIRKTLAGVRSEQMVILLSHNPDINEELTNNDLIPLVLSGHTHGGQARIPFTNWAPWVPCSSRYKGTTGLFRETERRWSFISKGIGSFLFPVRLSCPPDIAMLRLKAI